MMKVTTIRFARTIQTRPLHSCTIDVTADLADGDSASTTLLALRTFVDAQLDAELPSPRRQAEPDDDIPI
jgi:hypothetical protein